MAKRQKATCPNCNRPAVKLDHKGQELIACQSCRKVYAVTETGHKLTDKDWFADIEDRLGRLEAPKQTAPEPAGDDDDELSVDITFDDGDDDDGNGDAGDGR